MEQPVSRKERERQARRQIMLDAARVVIAEKGFKRATLDEIAQRAEFGKGTIYNYFREGKDEMLFAILDDVYDDLYQISLSTFGSVDSKSFRERLYGYVESFLGYFMIQQDLFVIIMKEANRIAFSDDDSKALYFKRQLDRLLGVIEPAIVSAVSRGEVKPYPSEAVAHMILGNVHGYLRYNCFRQIGDVNGDCAIDVDPRRAAEFLCSMLLDGLAATSPAINENIELEVEEGTP
jgi:AcrR family transcriptional regulator